MLLKSESRAAKNVKKITQKKKLLLLTTTTTTKVGASEKRKSRSEKREKNYSKKKKDSTQRTVIDLCHRPVETSRPRVCRATAAVDDARSCGGRFARLPFKVLAPTQGMGKHQQRGDSCSYIVPHISAKLRVASAGAIS